MEIKSKTAEIIAITLSLLVIGAAVFTMVWWSTKKETTTSTTTTDNSTNANTNTNSNTNTVSNNTVDPADLEEDVVEASNQIGFDLYAEILKNNQDENLFISPASIQYALAMTYNGAEGQTKKEMQQVMHIGYEDIQEYNQDSKDLMTYLENADEKVTIAIANSLWAQDGVTLSEDYQSDMESYFDAEVDNVDFSSQSEIDRINSWVNDKTNGKIETIFEGPFDAVLALINAVYFKGTWTYEFNPEDTTPMAFNLDDGTKTEVDMMMQDREDFMYMESDGFQAVWLPYGDEKLGMYVFLPSETSDLEEFHKNLTTENWNAWTTEFQEKEGILRIPKFEIEYERDLVDDLVLLGMEIPCTPNADFTKMFSSGNAPWISAVIHKTYVKVDEEGTEAAAVTAVVMVESAPGPDDTFKMTVDRPFFFAITDSESGVILFMGSITNPE